MGLGLGPSLGLGLGLGWAGLGLGLGGRRAALPTARHHHGGGQDEEEERCSPRQHRAKRCTCLSRLDVTVLPARDRRSVTMARAEEAAG